MQIRKSIQLVLSLMVTFLMMALPTSSKSAAAWKRYELNVKNVYACAFTPDSQRVAFYYWTSRLLSEKPWRAVYTSHLATWDFKTGQIEERLKWEYASNNRSDSWPLDRRYLDYTRDGRHLVLLGSEAIHVFDPRNFQEVRRIVVEPPKEKFPNDGWPIVDFSLSRDGLRAAVAISSSIGGNGGFIRVYNLSTGQIVREWKLRNGVFSVSDAALSPDGRQVVVSWQPSAGSSDPEAFIPSGTDNVRVMDVKTGETLTGMSTNYFAGPVLFGPNDTLLTGSMNDDRTGYKYDSVKIWDAKSGKLLREITAPRTGVHYRLDLSPDGKLLLGYIGTEKPVENFVNIDSQQFQIWDFAWGQVLATSPKFLPIGNEPPRLRLSADGRYVLVWWGDGTAKPVVYEVPQP